MAKIIFIRFENIMRISNELNKHAVFKAGLTPQIRREISKIDTKALEKEFAEINVDCRLKENKAIAGIIAICTNLLNDGYEKYSLPVSYLPPSIYVYNTKELIKPEICTGFCISDARKVLKNEKPFDVSSIFIKNQKDSLDEIDNLSELDYLSKLHTSNHFIQYVLHEFFHAIHFNSIFQRFGYEGESPFAKELYKNPSIEHPQGLHAIDKLSHPMISLYKNFSIYKNFGLYSTISKIELFADAMTKMFTDSINPDNLSLDLNPMDLLKNYPKFVQKFIKKELE